MTITDTERNGYIGPGVRVRYYTLRQIDRHELQNGTILDRDIVIRAKGEAPRDLIFKILGTRWGMEYRNRPDMARFPRGTYDLSPDDRLKTSTGE